jgi:hypothetical protein
MLKPGWVIKGYPYGFRTRVPLSVDIDFPIEYVWINVKTDTAYMLISITGESASWLVKEPDHIINEGTIGQVNVIGESNIGILVRSPGGGWVLPPNVVTSTPGVGDHQVTDVHVDENHKLVATYSG